MPIGQLTRATGEDYLILRRQDTFNGKTITVATVNREGAWLKGMLERAVDWEYLSENPFRKLTKFKEMNKRDVDLSLEQVEELAAALPHPMNLVVIFAACRGLRAEEIFSLRIENVTFFDMVPDSHTPVGKIVQKVKGGIAKTFVLDAQSTSVLQQAIGDRTEGYVFINARTRTRYAGVSQSFRKAVNRLGLTALQNGKRVPLTFHDLRHCFVTWLLNQGVPIDIAQHLVGHQSSQMTERYASRDSMALGRALSLLPKLTKVG